MFFILESLLRRIKRIINLSNTSATITLTLMLNPGVLIMFEKEVNLKQS